MTPDLFIQNVSTWAQNTHDIEGLLLVGSYARGNPRADSDIDLVIMAKDPKKYLDAQDWIKAFGTPTKVETEKWGALSSLRVRYASGLEVEFGLVDRNWASIDPLDKGTLQVVADAARILWDPNHIFSKLLLTVKGKSKSLFLDRAISTDIDEILALIIDLSVWLKSKGVSQWGSDYPKSVLSSEIERGEVFVYKEQADIIGSVTLSNSGGSYWESSAEPAIYLHRLAVKRSHAGKGLGHSLVGWAEDEVKRRGISVLRLDCAATNSTLQSYYSALGFQSLGIKHDSRYEMDFALFEKRLSERRK